MKVGVNYKALLVSRAVDLSQDDAPRALSPTQARNRQALEAWRARWARHHSHGREQTQ